jgi:hypothetical protein
MVSATGGIGQGRGERFCVMVPVCVHVLSLKLPVSCVASRSLHRVRKRFLRCTLYRHLVKISNATSHNILKNTELVSGTHHGELGNRGEKFCVMEPACVHVACVVVEAPCELCGQY